MPPKRALRGVVSRDQWAAQIAALVTTEVASLAPVQVAALATEQLAALAPLDVAVLTSAEIQAGTWIYAANRFLQNPSSTSATSCRANWLERR